MKAKNKIAALMMVLSLTLFFFQCSKDPQIPSPQVTGVTFTVPQGWPQPVSNFEENTLTDAGFNLGRRLFYEKKLSRDGSISCGSCHQQFAAFANAAHARSHGIDRQFGKRNAPALFNLNWQTSFMWDGGINHITVQPLAPINDSLEMDGNMNDVIAFLSADASYRKMFKETFGDEAVTTQRVLKSFAQFLGALVSSNSKYDRIQRGEAGYAFTADEEIGKSIFNQRCASCHAPPLFSNFSYRNIGLEPNVSLQDSGRMRSSESVQDMHSYKMPSLRNVEVSSPYMHDGRFKTLDKAIDYHINKPYYMSNVDPVILNGQALSVDEIQSIISFLNTLTDNTFIHDTRFSDPLYK